jgi:hypothetical protein
MTRAPLLAVPCGLVALMAAGCSAGGHPELTATAMPTAVPSITQPKSLPATRPCSALTGHQLAALALPAPGQSRKSSSGPECEWVNTREHWLTLTMFTGGSLLTLLQRSDPTTTRVRVEGYPALETFTGKGSYCRYAVGYRQGKAFVVAMQGGRPDSCTMLHAAIADILRNAPAVTES